MSLINKCLEKYLPDFIKARLSRHFPDYRYHLGRSEKKAGLWLKRLSGELIKLSLLTAAVGLVYLGCLYFIRAGWFIFKDTLIGARYIDQVNTYGAQRISRLLSLDFNKVAVNTLLTTLMACFQVAIISQLVMLRRFFYVGRSWLFKLAWIALVNTLVAFRLTTFYPIDLQILFGLCFFPTACILGFSLEACGKLIPELNISQFLRGYREKKELKELKNDLARIMEKNSEEDSH